MPRRLLGSRVVLRWRWRRFVVRRRHSLVSGLLAAALAGFLVAGDLRTALAGTVLWGRSSVYGAVLVRPLVARGVVRAATVTLVPLGPSGFASVLGVARPRPDRLVVVPDPAGTWAAPRVRRGWHYAVFVTAEGCPPRFAAGVDVGWLSASRVDLTLSSCDPDAPTPGCF